MPPWPKNSTCWYRPNIRSGIQTDAVNSNSIPDVGGSVGFGDSSLTASDERCSPLLDGKNAAVHKLDGSINADVVPFHRLQARQHSRTGIELHNSQIVRHLVFEFFGSDMHAGEAVNFAGSGNL